MKKDVIVYISKERINNRFFKTLPYVIEVVDYNNGEFISIMFRFKDKWSTRRHIKVLKREHNVKKIESRIVDRVSFEYPF